MKNSFTSISSLALEVSLLPQTEPLETSSTSSAISNPSRKRSSKSTGRRLKSTETSGLLPTPHANKLSPQSREDFTPNLAYEIETAEPLLPTPTTSMERQERMKKKQNQGTNRHSLFLTDAINLLPTPRAGDSKGGKYQYDRADHTKPRPTLTGLISSREVSLASLSPKLDEEGERKMTATSGLKCYELYGSFIRGGSSVKMLAALLLGAEVWYSNKSTLIWRLRATKSKRLLFQLLPSTRRIEEIGSGLLPTARVSESEGSPVKNAEMKNGSWSRVNAKGVRFGVKVKDVLASVMIPTPATRDYKGGSVSHPYDTVDSLVETGATKGGVGIKTGLKLQPAFVEWMMGYPEGWTELPDSKLLEMRSSRRSQKRS